MTSQKLIDEAIAEVLPSTDPLDDPNFDVKHVSVAACSFACTQHGNGWKKACAWNTAWK